ncbi:Hsp33 family molecular chaperone HslO [Pseudomonas sp. RIT-PI-S]|uniref:Hsp33 family molecular chaperone HslO n=1 Tax=Pseudomonas sp. RIT-PI-S TaxID=3035295 RepID=UPI0021D7FD14|nr:Hsp33 family molecular chaperone HslO [Pseudomonas sp. RIT-PI-S]
MHDLPNNDFTQRFIFDDADVRGEMVSLERSYAEVLAKHPYPAPVAKLLGEFVAAAALLAGTLKFDGLLILQARSDGPIPLLMVECSNTLQVRGLARYDQALIGAEDGLQALMPNGTLAMTIDPTQGQRYQGIVSLDGENLSACFSNYFALSEQLGTRFRLEADGHRARGMLLQQLPAEKRKDPQERDDNWQHLLALAGTLSTQELLSLDNETILHRLYHEEQVRLFDRQPVEFQCSCSRERSARALISLGEDDAQALLKEEGGTVEIDCQFCNQRYLFDAADVAQLFAGGGVDAPSDSRH